MKESQSQKMRMTDVARRWADHSRKVNAHWGPLELERAPYNALFFNLERPSIDWIAEDFMAHHPDLVVGGGVGSHGDNLVVVLRVDDLETLVALGEECLQRVWAPQDRVPYAMRATRTKSPGRAGGGPSRPFI